MNLLKYLEEHNFPSGKELTNSKHKEFKEEVMKQTSFIDEIIKSPVFGIRLSSIVEGVTTVPKCKTCGDHVGVRKTAHTNTHYAAGWAVYCSLKCSNSDPDVISKKMEGMDFDEAARKRKRFYEENPEAWEQKVEKTKQTNLKKTNGKYTSNLATPEHREFTKNKFMKEKGVPHHMHIPEIKEKVKVEGKWFFETDEFIQKKLEDWGENGHPMTRDNVLQKRRRERIRVLGRDIDHTQKHIPQEVLDILNDREQLSKLYDEHGFHGKVAHELGVHQSTIQRACSRLGIEAKENHTVSAMELELREYVISLVGTENVETNINMFGRNNFDIFIPPKNIAIEFNGVYWHSDEFKDKNYHQKRSVTCMNNDVLLIHVWEDDWKDCNKRTIIKNKIRSKVGISDRVYARKCEVVVLDYKDAHNFLEATHIQGKTTASIWLGLKYGDEIVSCLGMKRLKEEGKWDLVRYATSKSVVGGFSRLLKRFKDENEWNHIVTYAHLDYSHGNLYEQTGFTNEGLTVAGMWYLKGDKRYRRETFMKHKLKDVLEGFDESLSEYENMKLHGFKRIYDAGSIKYTMTNS